MVIELTRWSPLNCSCIFEVEIDREAGDTDNKFHLVYRVCAKHKHLIVHKDKFREDHSKLAQRTLGAIERVKAGNLARAIDVMNSAELEIHREDAARGVEQVKLHNERITREWTELVSRPYAYDSEIYDVVLKENQTVPSSGIIESAKRIFTDR